jgi:hypothetical protein
MADAWGDIRRAIAIHGEAVARAAAELAARPGDSAAAEMAGLCAGVMGSMEAALRQIVFDAELLDQARAQGWDEGYAAGLAARQRRLQAVPSRAV